MKNRIKTALLTPVAFAIFVSEQNQLRREEKAYDAMIADSRAKIGPYKPVTTPVQVWA